MSNSKKQLVPDPTRGKTLMYWESTYVWTTKFLNEHPELKIGAEIGCAAGQHIKAIMEETKVEKMYGVDPYISETWDMHGWFDLDGEYGGLDGLYEEVCDMLSPYGDRVEMIRKKSTDAAPDFEDGCLDFVFIDAFHDYENCYNDIAFWHHRVRKGGYVMGHDWDHGLHPGVQQAVLEHYGDAVQGIPGPVHVWYIEV